MFTLPPASREEVAELVGDVDSAYVDRILDTEASIDEIGEAIDDLEGRFAAPHIPSSTRVARVLAVLREMSEAQPSPYTFPLRGMPVTHV